MRSTLLSLWCLCLLITAVVLPTIGIAEETPTVAINSATTDKGLLIADVSTRGLLQGDTPLPVALYASHGSSCVESLLLGWGMGSSDGFVHISTAIPDEIPAGNIGIIAVASTNGSFPTACDSLASAPIQINLPARESNPDAIATGYSDTQKGNGTDYQILTVTLPQDEQKLSPGSAIHPQITVKNTGSDDSGGAPVPTSAYLGLRQLVPQAATIPALRSGEEQTATLAYTIPADMDLKLYRLTLVIDPEPEKNEISQQNNIGRAPGQVSVTAPPGPPLLKDCGCGQA
ncbi:MAG TPA: CARDB domain-containing protein [Methanospirillum sp.]|nr:CARDB domain-containing protein [Methanospirillum sp.]